MLFGIVSFVLAFTQRIASGFQSMFGYSKKKFGFAFGTLLMLSFPLFFIKAGWVFWLYLIVNTMIVYMKTMSFRVYPQLTAFNKYSDIHLWEDLLTGGYAVYLTLSGFNILMIICAMYPALIMHKGLINIGSNQSFFASATDDATGKTYGIPLLGIKVNRSSTKFRLVLAGLSLVGAYLVLKLGWSLTL